jgi:tight adherence protein B
MLFVNHDYIALLWSSLLGWLMLTVAFVGMVVGTFWMSRVVKVEV